MNHIQATNIVWHEGHVDRNQREALLSQKGILVWLTGFSMSWRTLSKSG